ncbi:MAG: OmpA family protein [Pseudomonadota bacterium]|nr:OmpA family protein [Pseudomonadota bacterium]
MAILDELTEEIAVRFDLGPKARALVQEVSGLIAAQPGGIGGFLDKFRAAGLEVKVASWLGGPFPMALSVREVKMALGDEAIEGIAENARVTEGFASSVLGYAIPKIIGLLTSGGAIPEAIPPAILRSPGSAHPFSSPRVADFTLGGEGQVPLRGMEGGGHAAGLRLVVPGAALLITLGLFGYVISSGTAGDRAPIQSASSAAQNAPVASPQTPSMPSHLALGNENGVVAYSGTVANGANPSATTDSLKSALRADKITADLAVKAGWIKNLSAAFDGFRSQDSQALFAGNEFNVRGTIAHADSAWMIGSLLSAQLPQFVVAAMTGSGAANMRIASSTSKLGSSSNESVRLPNQATLDFPIINFPANSAKVSSSSLPLLRRIAGQIKQLPPGTVVQLNGYTDSTGTPAGNVELSQRRADSVYRVLVHAGVSPAMLSAKGYGSSPSVASINGIMEGRSNKITGDGGRQRYDRRVEFRVVQQRP